MDTNWTYEEAIKKADHFLAIGKREIYLSEPPFPWEHTLSVEPGGSHRLDIATNVWFRAKEPKTGLEFRWAFDIEPREANGKGHYMIDVEGCIRTISLLPEAIRLDFQKYLDECAKEVEKNAKELADMAGREFYSAIQLRKASEYVPGPKKALD